MALIVKHEFVSAVTDGADTAQVQPSNWNEAHTLSGCLSIAKVDGLQAALDDRDTSASIATKLAAYVSSASLSAEVSAKGFITSASASAAFVTSASLATTLGTYITSGSLSADIVSRGFILSTSVSAAIAEFVTSASISTRIAATYDLGPTVSTSVSYSLAIADVGQTVVMNNASTNYVVVPSSASIAIAVGEVVNVVQKGAGATIIQGETGVTINGSLAGSATIQTQYQGVSLLKDSADSWIASGDIGTFAT